MAEEDGVEVAPCWDAVVLFDGIRVDEVLVDNVEADVKDEPVELTCGVTTAVALENDVLSCVLLLKAVPNGGEAVVKLDVLGTNSVVFDELLVEEDGGAVPRASDVKLDVLLKGTMIAAAACTESNAVVVKKRKDAIVATGMAAVAARRGNEEGGA